ncbi:uncharacterized protein LOC113342422 [Papaver somniferum]|uniref:uncharacterized protein LOC113342422 n=1 Tax=Papaver somniferum TaxID=3469 RepID=UPI000E6F781E|nr:uncharacterized protein LOC113342422 [Papaver somniferum]
MAPRGPNFTTEEDTMICRIHLAISQDSATGTDQPERVLWSRIKDKLEEALPCKPKRTWTSIQSRFQGISRQVSLYSAKVLEVDGEYHSGWNEVSRVEEIRKRFKESNGNKKFKHEECYEILKDSIKYSGRSTFVFDSGQEMEDSQSGEENADIEETIPGESSDDLDIGDIENTRKRQLGKKASKQLKKTGRAKSNAQEEMLEDIIKEQQSFNEHYKAQSLMKMGQRKAEFEAIQAKSAAKFAAIQAKSAAKFAAKQARQEKLDLKKEADDDLAIMLKDVSTLDTVTREYFELRKMEILQRKRNQS